MLKDVVTLALIASAIGGSNCTHPAQSERGQLLPKQDPFLSEDERRLKTIHQGQESLRIMWVISPYIFSSTFSWIPQFGSARSPSTTCTDSCQFFGKFAKQGLDTISFRNLDSGSSPFLCRVIMMTLSRWVSDLRSNSSSTTSPRNPVTPVSKIDTRRRAIDWGHRWELGEGYVCISMMYMMRSSKQKQKQ